ncbi:TadE family type IV pilus minor pilin [Leifsonia sp. LS-T14]|uniref:TadE family type IV pilus minor pilin n=1 Tax=unclassified Leifsonia TaxID=2663824 RepID=UPI0035A70871
MALPAVLATLALCVGVIHGMAQYVALAGQASVAARLAGRGDDPARAAGAAGAGGASASIEKEGEVLCVRVTAPDDTVLTRIGVRLSARACALDETAAG